MLKKQRRRQDEKRVKDRFKKVVKRQTEWMTNANHREWKYDENGKVIALKITRDPVKAVERLRLIERGGAQMAHHPRHDCEMCREDKKEERSRRLREIQRKAPMYDGSDE